MGYFLGNVTQAKGVVERGGSWVATEMSDSALRLWYHPS